MEFKMEPEDWVRRGHDNWPYIQSMQKEHCNQQSMRKMKKEQVKEAKTNQTTEKINIRSYHYPSRIRTWVKRGGMGGGMKGKVHVLEIKEEKKTENQITKDLKTEQINFWKKYEMLNSHKK